MGNPSNFSTTHIVTIYSLTPDTEYHYQLRSATKLGNESRSGDFSFKTQNEVLNISNYTIDKADTQKAIFRWVTNVGADSKLTYTPYRNGLLSGGEAVTQSKEEQTTIHEISINNFEAGVQYQVILQSTDTDNNTATREIPRFSTAEDDLPPEIYQVQTKSALAEGTRSAQVQTIISWKTNEPATGQIFYRQGIGPMNEEDNTSKFTPLDESYSKQHVAVITSFEPGQVYQFRVESIDSGGNKSISNPFTILTPRREETVFQIIMKNLENLFGWIGKIRR